MVGLGFIQMETLFHIIIELIGSSALWFVKNQTNRFYVVYFFAVIYCAPRQLIIHTLYINVYIFITLFCLSLVKSTTSTACSTSNLPTWAPWHHRGTLIYQNRSIRRRNLPPHPPLLKRLAGLCSSFSPVLVCAVVVTSFRLKTSPPTWWGLKPTVSPQHTEKVQWYHPHVYRELSVERLICV